MRDFLLAVAMAAALEANAVGADETPRGNEARGKPESVKPVVGAIRWDAWHGDAGLEHYAKAGGRWKNLTPGLAVERSLGPKHWHYRLPFFAECRLIIVCRLVN